MGGGIILCTTLLTGRMCTGITHHKARRTSQHPLATFPKLIHINVYIVINVQRRRFPYFLHTLWKLGFIPTGKERKEKAAKIDLILTMCKKQVLGLFVIFNFVGYTVMLIFPPFYRKGKLRFREGKYLVPEHTASEYQDLFLLHICFPGS